MIFFKGFNQWDFVPLGPSLFPTLELINKILQGIFPIVLGAPWSDTVCHSRSTPPKIQGIHPMGLCDPWDETVSFSKSTPFFFKGIHPMYLAD